MSNAVFTTPVDVDVPTLFEGCEFRAGVWFRVGSLGSVLIGCDLSNNYPNHHIVRAEPESRATLMRCHFSGSTSAGVLISGRMHLIDCTASGRYADNLLQANGWGGGVVTRFRYAEAGEDVGNAIVNARHADGGTNPGYLILEQCSIRGRKCVIVGDCSEHVVLRGNDIHAPPSPAHGELYYAYSAWGPVVMPAEHAGNRFAGEVRFGETVLTNVAPQAPLPQVLSSIEDGPWWNPATGEVRGYGISLAVSQLFGGIVKPVSR